MLKNYFPSSNKINTIQKEHIQIFCLNNTFDASKDQVNVSCIDKVSLQTLFVFTIRKQLTVNNFWYIYDSRSIDVLVTL